MLEKIKGILEAWWIMQKGVNKQGPSLRLGVNIDHVATLRQARGTSYPDVEAAARICQQAGADGITVHLREDRRHIQDEDVWRLRKSLTLPLNLEMAVAESIVVLAEELAPAEVCLVPERRAELTTEGGLDVAGQEARIAEVVRRLAAVGTQTSLFIDPDAAQIRAAVRTGAGMIELHTGAYCDATEAAAEDELQRLRSAAVLAHGLGIQVNAGHGIHLGNVQGILRIPYLDMLNIGHSIIAHAVFVGLGRAVEAMRQALAGYRGGEV